ncbi:MAG: cupin domain-containing protein [Armatimonadetes bacterium]|nr:cupin domain-containing protein [Armatimonadota bacterium]
MDPLLHPWDAVPVDSPVPLLQRQMITGDQALLAMVNLAKGCHVALHSHASEQFAYVVSGRVLWTLGAEGSSERRQVEVTGGHVVRLPANFPHGVDALEDTVILDILAPPGAMGVDSQGRGH